MKINPDQQATASTISPLSTRQRSVASFSTRSNISSFQLRIQNSPLQVPLSIAIKNVGLLINQNNSNHQNISKDARKQHRINCGKKQEIKNSFSYQLQLQKLKKMSVKMIQQSQELFCRKLQSRINSQMKRMVIKYRQLQNILKQVEQIIQKNQDSLSFHKVYTSMEQFYQQQIFQRNEKLQLLSNKLLMQTKLRKNKQEENSRLNQEIDRINKQMQKYEEILINKFINHEATHINQPEQIPADSLLPDEPQLISSSEAETNPHNIDDKPQINSDHIQNYLNHINNQYSNINMIPPTNSPQRKAHSHPRKEKDQEKDKCQK